MRLLRLGLTFVALSLVLASSHAHAQGVGFQLNRYEPTPAGEWSFMVDKPWYSSTRWFAGGLTLDWAHNPLTYGYRLNSNESFHEQGPIISNMLAGHVDIAGSFLDRVTLSASLPVVFLENGNTADGITPLHGAAVGDPRFGAMFRLWRHTDRDPISLHLGVDVWAPIEWKADQGDHGVRVMPKVVLAGYASHVTWSFTGAFYYRPKAYIGDMQTRGSSMGSEVQLGFAVGYADWKRGWQIGPEALLSSIVIGGDAFRRSYTSLELLLGFHYWVKRVVLLGASAGIGTLREPGTPDVRLLFRAAYAPERKRSVSTDRDGDGIPDDLDRCPDDPEDRDGFEDANGCPDPDNDKDGVLDVVDRCPNEPGPTDNAGCPDKDRDGDGVVDRLDKCPNDPEDKDGFEDADGCPDPDNDKDGVLDINDRCPNDPGPVENKGCPDKDRDGDGVVDRLDACPDEPGDPANRGCKKKQLAQIKEGHIEILESVYFANDKDAILARSFPVLENVAELMKSHPDIERLLVEGHTDSRGKLAHNVDLSERRARSVMRFLVKQGVVEARLDARGFGPSKPIADNATDAGRAKNRRVVFTIVGPATSTDGGTQPPTSSEPAK